MMASPAALIISRPFPAVLTMLSNAAHSTPSQISPASDRVNGTTREL